MKRVIGIGGIFMKCKDPEAIRQWYQLHLGFNTDVYGTNFGTRDLHNPDQKQFSVWSTFPAGTDYFEPSSKDFMLNFRVENLEALLPQLKEEGVAVIGEMQNYPYGKFAHIIDPEGNKIELWEANDKEFEKMIGKNITS